MKMKKINWLMTVALVGGSVLIQPDSVAQINLNGVKNTGSKVVNGNKENKETKTETTNTTETTTTTTTSSDKSNSPAGPKTVVVTAPTLIMTQEMGGVTGESSFEPGNTIFMRFAFPKPVGEFFAETIGATEIPSTGTYALAIGKNADDENPIIIYGSDFYPSRYTKETWFDLVLQGDDNLTEELERPSDELLTKVSFISVSTMAPIGLKDEWARQASLFSDQTHTWEAFLFFMPKGNEDESKVKLVAQGKFNYVVTAENRGKLAENMNFYDRQRFEKTPDDGMTTSVHKANAGKLVFSTSKMLKDFDNTSALKTSFENFSGGIYARLYLKESMRNFYANSGNGKDVSGAVYRMHFYVDGAAQPSCFVDGALTQEDALKITSWSVPLAPLNQEDFEYDKATVNRFAYVVSELLAGKHTIKIVTKAETSGAPSEGSTLAEGEFSVNVALTDRDAFVKKYGLKLPEKGLLEGDTKLYTEVKKLAGPSAIDVRCPNTWENKFDAWGTLTHRVTIVCYSFKDTDGRCKMGTFMVEQPKNSNGFGATTLSLEKTWYGVDNYLPFQNSK